jgi:hypothetical protein
MAGPITSYTTLVERVTSNAGGSSDAGFATAIEEAIQLAEEEMNNRLRVPEMMVRSIETVNEVWESLPPTALEFRAAWLVDDDGNEVRPLRTWGTERIAHMARYRSTPKGICVAGGQYRIEPRSSDETYRVRLWYYAKLPDLTASSACTAVLLRYPLLYLYGALSKLGSWVLNHESFGWWNQQFDAGIERANMAAGRRVRSWAA